MKKQMGIVILMLCAAMAWAQTIVSPGYVEAYKNGATSPLVRMYKEMYKDIRDRDTHKFYKNFYENEFGKKRNVYWEKANLPRRMMVNMNSPRAIAFSYVNEVTGGKWEAHHVGRLIDLAIEMDRSNVLRALHDHGKYYWKDYTITYPDGKQEEVVIADYVEKAVKLKKMSCVHFFLRLENGRGRALRERVPESVLKEGEALLAAEEAKNRKVETAKKEVGKQVNAGRKSSKKKK